jgi:hypothetical protein
LVVRTRSSSSTLPPVGNPRASASVLVGLLALAAVPAGIALSWYSSRVTLLNSAAGSVPAAALLGLYAVVLARRGREQVERTLGRSGGEVTARVGRALGVLGVCAAVTAALAVGFYGLLTLFAA